MLFRPVSVHSHHLHHKWYCASSPNCNNGRHGCQRPKDQTTRTVGRQASGGGLENADRAPRIVQQLEIIDVPIRIEEHRGRAYWCGSCQKFHYAPLPPEVEQGQLFGPRLTTLVAYMKGVCHASPIAIVSLDGRILAQLAFRFRIAEQPGHPIPVPRSTPPQGSRHGIPRFTDRAVNGYNHTRNYPLAAPRSRPCRHP